jgi:hypothetical protein
MSNNKNILNVAITTGASIIAGSVVHTYIKNRNKRRRINEIDSAIRTYILDLLILRSKAEKVLLDPNGSTEEMQEIYRQSKYLEAMATELAEEKQNLLNR